MSIANAKKPVLRLPSLPTGYQQRWVWVMAALRRLGSYCNISVSIDGADSASIGSDGGLQFKVGSGGRTATTLGLNVGSDGTVIAAKVMDIMPTIGGTTLDTVPAPTLSIASSGTKYIVINVSGTFDLKGGTFVLPTYSGTPTVTITVDSTDPGYAGTHSVSTGNFKFLLATFVDGVKTSQNGHGPISAEICDNLKNEAKANFNLTWASA